ncbi:MAG: hypothetical protein J3R72DRAFT_460626 [Linnemannia gamsii]|nr:MAG: hypothetical protein J3R72DRAFT_460626 [Linnemannia gamsii]
MRPFFACLLAAVVPAACLADQTTFCEDKFSSRGRLFGRPAYHDLQEQVPGMVFFDRNQIYARVQMSAYWSIYGELEEKLPVDELPFDSVVFTLNHPSDFEGSFVGWIGQGEILLKWEKSGATITGPSNHGDFKFKGKTQVEWSP